MISSEITGWELEIIVNKLSLSTTEWQGGVFGAY
jgi:hypothetical protein